MPRGKRRKRDGMPARVSCNAPVSASFSTGVLAYRLEQAIPLIRLANARPHDERLVDERPRSSSRGAGSSCGANRRGDRKRKPAGEDCAAA